MTNTCYQAEIYIYDSTTGITSFAATTRYVATMEEAYTEALKEQEFYTRLGMLVVRIKFVCKEHKEPYSPDTHAMLKLAAAEEMYPDYDVDEDGNVYRC